jgi:hypothetical protein
MLRMMTFVVTLVAMAAGMSYLPLFPQPLPIFLAVLVGFVTYQYPIVGMPAGGAVIGLGLLYHLSLDPFHFISFLGGEQIRVAFVVAWMALFVGLPVVFHRYKSALAIDFGILAVIALFSSSTYFLAIPLILASAVYFKKYVSLTVIYYGLISVPLQIVQYYIYTVKPIIQSDWWNAPGSSPPLFVSLTQVASSLSSSMGQFRLYDASQFVYAITGQLTWIPNTPGRTLAAALSQYLDSMPGIVMFLIVVVGLAMGLVFFTRIFVRGGSGGFSDRVFPCFTATIAAALFFILLGALSQGLAFTATADAGTLVMGTLATLLFTFPVAFMETTPKQTVTAQQIADKLKGVITKIEVLGDQINNVKATIPVVVSGPEGKLLILTDTINYVLKQSEKELYDPYELSQKFSEMEKLGKNVDEIESDLGTVLTEYQIFVSCEYSNWIGRLRDSGLDVKSTVNVDFQKVMPLDARIEAIKQILEAGRTLAKDVAQIAEPIYAIIRPLYDPTLPEKCRAVEFTMQKIETKEAPWIAIEALYSSLNNWSRQYGAEIQASMRYLQDSLTPIANLSSESEVLPPVFGENTPQVLDYAKKAEGMRLLVAKKIEKEKLNIVDVISLRDDLQTFLGIANDVLGMLYAELVNEEDTIDRLLPTKEYLWETNSTIRERLKNATETLSNPSNYKINQIMENLPTMLSYVDEGVQTLAIYSERREFLLNYPTAEAAIAEQLRTKKRLSPKDLPFQPHFAAEYLRLYYTQRFSEFAYDKENQELIRKG